MEKFIPKFREWLACQDPSNWSLWVHVPFKECIDLILAEIETRFLVLEWPGEEPEGTFTEEEKHQIMRVFGGFKNCVQDFTSPEYIQGRLNYVSAAYVQYERTRDRLPDKFLRKCFCGGRRFRAEIICNLASQRFNLDGNPKV